MRLLQKLAALNLAIALAAALLYSLERNDSSLGAIRHVLRGRVGPDSSRVMDQAWEVMSSGKPLYRSLFFNQHVKFIYPVSSMLTYSLAGVLHITPILLLKLLILLSVPATLWLSGDIFLLVYPGVGQLTRGMMLQARLLVALLGLLFFPIVNAVSLGNLQAVLLFCWTLAAWFWIRGRMPWAGVAIALACIFKPQLGVFLVWALFRRQWRFAFGFVLAAIIIQALAIRLYGWPDEIGYLAVLSFITHHGEAFAANQSVNGFLERLLKNGPITHWSMEEYPPYNRFVYLGTIFSSALFVAFGLVGPPLLKWKDRVADFLMFGMLLTIASPVAWRHHYGYFFPACLYFFARTDQAPRKIIGCFVAFYVILSNCWTAFDAFSARTFTPLLSYDLFAGLGVVVLFVVVLSGRTTPGIAVPRSFKQSSS